MRWLGILLAMVLLAGCANVSGLAEPEKEDKDKKKAERIIEAGTYYTSGIKAYPIMGTMFTMGVYLKEDMTEAQVKALIDGAMEEARALDVNLLSRREKTSQLKELNDNAGSMQAIRVSEKMYEILEQCEDMREASNGAFDVTLGPVISLWRMDEKASGEENPSVPSAQEIQEALSHCGKSALRLRDGEVLLSEGAVLDFGAIGKGVAMDVLTRYLEDKVQAGLMVLGGSILCVGDKPDGKPWYVGIVDPNDTEKRIGALALNGNWCISTSGDYERYFMQGDKKYHHIIDPATGYPTDNGIRSVTIVSKSGFISDALSTACFVLGKEKGMALAARYGAEILIVDAAGEITMSEGLNSIFYDVNSLKP